MYSDPSPSATSYIVKYARFSSRQSLQLHVRIVAVSRTCISLFRTTSHASNPTVLSVNNDRRLAERKHNFDDEQLRRLAAQAVGRTLQEVATMEKLDEGGFNRIFLITMHDGFQMIARIPYPVTQPKFYAVASEVATMAFLRASGLPIPKVYGYSPTADNAAKTEYIFMEFVRGTKLTDVWMTLKEADLASILRKLVKLESHIMSLSFPAGGSLYYSEDLERVTSGKTGIPILLNGERFCIGPDARLHMWYGRRSQLDVDRGPCMSLSFIFSSY